MPAEWEPHSATWLAWPHYEGDWPGKFEPIPWVYAEIIRNLARHESVELIVNDVAAERRVQKLLTRADALSKNMRFHRWRTDRVWLRDSGCIFVLQKASGAKAQTFFRVFFGTAFNRKNPYLFRNTLIRLLHASVLECVNPTAA